MVHGTYHLSGLDTSPSTQWSPSFFGLNIISPSAESKVGSATAAAVVAAASTMDTADQDVNRMLVSVSSISLRMLRNLLWNPHPDLTHGHGIKAMESISAQHDELAVGLQCVLFAKSPFRHPLGFHPTHNRVLERKQSQLLPFQSPLPQPQLQN